MRLAEAAQLLGISKHTLARWEREGKVACHKTTNERRFYTTEDLQIIRRTMKLGTKLEKPRLAQLKPQQTIQTRRKPQPDPASEPACLDIDWDTYEAMDDAAKYHFITSQPNPEAVIKAAPYEDLRSELSYMWHNKTPLNTEFFPGIARPNMGDE